MSGNEFKQRINAIAHMRATQSDTYIPLQYMKVKVGFLVRHCTNVDVLERGWNRFSFRFIGRRPLDVSNIKKFKIPYDNVDRKDPTRFFDKAQYDFTFDEQNCSLTCPPCRIEYHDQIVQFNYGITFILDTEEDDLLLQYLIDFNHCKNGVQPTAPAQYERKFERFWELRGLKIPAICPILECYSEIHVALTETLVVWCGVGKEQEKIFKQMYQGQTFEDVVRLCS